MAAASVRRAISMRSAGGMLVDVVEVEVEVAVELAELVGFGESGEGVFAGDLCEGDGAVDETGDALGGEVGGGGAGGALADKDAEADGARAGFLEGFDLAEVDERGELVAFVDDGFGVGGSGFEGAGEDVGGELLEVGLCFGGHVFFKDTWFGLVLRCDCPTRRDMGGRHTPGAKAPFVRVLDRDPRLKPWGT